MRNSTLLKTLGAAFLFTAVPFSVSAQNDITAVTVKATTPQQGTTVAPVMMDMIIVDINEPIYFRAISSDDTKAAFVEGITLVREGDNLTLHPTNYTVVRNNGQCGSPSDGDAIIGTEVKNRIALEFGRLEAGTYTLNFAERALQLGASWGYTYNGAFSVGPWTVEAGDVVVNPFEDGYTLSPANGALCYSLKTFHVAFNPVFVDGDFLGELDENAEISLVSNGVTVGGAAAVTEDADGRGFTVAFAEEVTAEGTYTLNIPEGLYTSVKGDFKSPAITASYEIKGNPFTGYTLNPEDGSDISVPTSTTLVFYVTFEGETLDERIRDWDEITLSNGERSYSASQGMKTGGGTGFMIQITQVNDMPSGTYTLRVPEGFYQSTTGMPTPAIEATYQITNPSVGVAGIESEEGVADVYDLAGRKVLRAADADAVRSLDNGLYIVNGKRVLVRK